MPDLISLHSESAVATSTPLVLCLSLYFVGAEVGGSALYCLCGPVCDVLTAGFEPRIGRTGPLIKLCIRWDEGIAQNILFFFVLKECSSFGVKQLSKATCKVCNQNNVDFKQTGVIQEECGFDYSCSPGCNGFLPLKERRTKMQRG